MIQVVIVAPILAVRAGLRALLAGEPAVEVTWEAASLAESLEFPADVDVLVTAGDVDLDAPGFHEWLQQQVGHVALLTLTDHLEAARSLERLPLRAWGCLPMDASAEELAAAVRALDEGLLVGSPALLQPRLRQLMVSEEIAVSQVSAGLIEPLTERETQVLQLLGQGLANKQIAHLLAISEHTVKFHVSSIYAKLGATNRTEAVRLGVQRGLLVL